MARNIKESKNITGYSMETNMLIIAGKSPTIKLQVVSQHLKIQYAKCTILCI